MCENGPKLVFLISLARSGSTLLQRILAAHPQIASVGEPWVLLPLAYMDQDYGAEAVFGHRNTAKGIREMIQNLSEKRSTYICHLRRFCLGLFEDLARGKPIFLDKDPRYYLILDFLVEVFPDAKFIFLFRNPLDVMCSIMSTWLRDRLILHAYHIDLYEGVRSMSRGSRLYAAQSICVHYEELVRQPEQEVRRVCGFLRLDYRDDLLLNYKNVDFGGSMGDPTGIHRYKGVSTDSVSLWPKKLNNQYRVRFARRYLRALGNDVLKPWAFSIEEFERTVSEMDIRLRGSIRDMGYRRVSDMWRFLSGRRLRNMLRERKVREVYPFG